MAAVVGRTRKSVVRLLRVATVRYLQTITSSHQSTAPHSSTSAPQSTRGASVNVRLLAASVGTAVVGYVAYRTLSTSSTSTRTSFTTAASVSAAKVGYVYQHQS